MKNNNVNILLVGYGYWGKIWYNTIMKSEYNLVGVVDPMLMSLPDSYVPYINLDEVNIDFTHVIIATPPSTHLLVYKKLKEKFNLSDKQILIEKPVGMNLGEATMMQHCCHDLVWLYDVAYRNIKNIIKSDRIGEMLLYQTCRASMGPRIRTDVSIIEDYLFHDIYLYLDITSDMSRDINTEITVENCNLRKSRFSAHSSLIQNDTITVGLSDNRGSYHTDVEMFSSWIYPKKERKIVVVGTKGSLICDNNSIFINDSKYEKFQDSFQRDIYGNIGYELIIKDPVALDIEFVDIDFVDSKSNLEKLLDNFIDKKLVTDKNEFNLKDYKFIQSNLVIKTHEIINKIKHYGETYD